MRLSRPVALLATAMVLAACGSSATTSPTDAPSGPLGIAPLPTRSITVFAASSLKESFTTIAVGFMAANPGTTVTFNFGASSTLATQITQKAPADVFASASMKTMDTVISSGAAVSSQVFAVNTMEIATSAQPSTPVTGLADLTKAGVKVAVCQQVVPCGAAAVSLFTKNNLTVTPVSEEVDVKSVLSKVVLGEVDAGIVYVTDVRAAKNTVAGIAIPADQNVTTTYPIAAITTKGNPAAAQAFVDYVLSSAGQSVLSAAGFTSP